jgi:hypothetical protein
MLGVAAGCEGGGGVVKTVEAEVEVERGVGVAEKGVVVLV